MIVAAGPGVCRAIVSGSGWMDLGHLSVATAAPIPGSSVPCVLPLGPSRALAVGASGLFAVLDR